MKKRIGIILSAMCSFMLVGSMVNAQDMTAPASESNGRQFCSIDGEVPTSLSCFGGYCAELDSYCKPLALATTGAEVNMPSFSEEEGEATCAPGWVLSGYDVTGWDSNGDNISMTCVELSGWYIDSCYWTQWISEEVDNTEVAPAPGWATIVPDSTTSSGYDNSITGCVPTNEYIAGMRCDGPWCNNMAVQCCSYTNTPPAVVPVDLGVINHETTLTVNAGVPQPVFIDASATTTSWGWTPVTLIVQINQADNKVLDGVTATVGSTTYNLTGWYTEIAIPNDGTTKTITINTGAEDRTLRITWWGRSW